MAYRSHRFTGNTSDLVHEDFILLVYIVLQETLETLDLNGEHGPFAWAAASSRCKISSSLRFSL